MRGKSMDHIRCTEAITFCGAGTKTDEQMKESVGGGALPQSDFHQRRNNFPYACFANCVCMILNQCLAMCCASGDDVDPEPL